MNSCWLNKRSLSTPRLKLLTRGSSPTTPSPALSRPSFLLFGSGPPSAGQFFGLPSKERV